MKNKDGSLKCFGKVDMYQDRKPHTRHCIVMGDELKLCNDALRKECLKINKYNKKKENEMENSRQLKGEKILHYLEKEPSNFITLKLYTDPEDMNCDEDGDVFFSTKTVELMEAFDVTVFITPGTKTNDVVRILEKCKTWVQKEFSQVGSKDDEDYDVSSEF